MLKRLQRGDTLIEVLFAVSVFSFIVITALLIMNQGTAASQRALSITLVRQEIDAQAETLRFMHDSYVAEYHSEISFVTDDNNPDTGEPITSPSEEWYRMLQSIVATDNKAVSEFGTCPSGPAGKPADGSFIVDTKNVRFISSAEFYSPADSSSEVAYNTNGSFTGSKGLWIEAIRSGVSNDADQADTGFIDFHIRACWDTPGQAFPMTLGTIVRLYEPRG